MTYHEGEFWITAVADGLADSCVGVWYTLAALALACARLLGDETCEDVDETFLDVGARVEQLLDVEVGAVADLTDG